MAIKAECGECGRVHNVSDDLDGKRFRCKECHAAVLAQSEPIGDWCEVLDEEPYQPPVRKSAKKSAKKGKRKSRRDGLPLPIIAALVCVATMIGMTLFDIIRNFMSEAAVVNFDVIGRRMFEHSIRMSIQIVVFRGVLKGSARTMIPSITMAVLVTLMSSGIAAVASFAPGGTRVVVLYVLMALLRVVFIGCMLTPTARDYMRN